MDNSDDAFRAAKRTIELIKDQNSKKSKSIDTNSSESSQKDIGKKNNIPKIIAFHSIEHHKISENIILSFPSSFGESYSIPATDYRKLLKENILYGKKILKKTETLFNKHNIDIETRLIKHEKPEDYIEKAVKDEKIDLLVLGSKGDHSKLKQIFSSTIAEKALNDVPCDILIVR